MELDDQLPRADPPDGINVAGAAVPVSDVPRGEKRRRASVEDVRDEDDPEKMLAGDGDDPFAQLFPEEYQAGATHGTCKSKFEQLRDSQRAKLEPWEPFKSLDEWELARWMVTAGLSQSKIDEFLKLKVIRENVKPSFHNNYSFLQYIDSLPSGPKWSCRPFVLTGDEVGLDGQRKTMTVELWHRDILECVAELLGDARLANQAYEPQRIFESMDDGGRGVNREYSEMHTGDWWWETQLNLPVGGTLCPLVIASDKTQLTQFSGDQQAWPVYLTIGNIDTNTRRRPSSGATVLLGYIPVAKMEIFEKENRSDAIAQLFHDCLSAMLDPVRKAGMEGVAIECFDGFVRMIHAVLAAYIADYPEQCLIACIRENSCPICLVGPKQRGDYKSTPPPAPRNQADTLRTLSQQSKGQRPRAFVENNLRVLKPFWQDLPRSNIYSCFNPELLHEFHNGVFGHIVSWSSAAMEGVGPEIDQRFRAMTRHPSLRHFKKGITLTTQWTGMEHQNMEKVYLGILANATDPRVIRAVRGILDYGYYAHFEKHTDESLALMEEAMDQFHANKQVFQDLGIRNEENGFNISKLHKLPHYMRSIIARGVTGGYSTELSERLHIDFAKFAYKASNRNNYIPQMTKWLGRQEKVRKFAAYLEWALPAYQAEFVDLETEDVPVDDGAPAPLTSSESTAAPMAAPSGPTLTALEDEVISSLAPSVAKVAPFPALSAASIAEEFNAPQFLFRVTDFLHSQAITPHHELTPTSTFSVYKQLSVALPLVQEVTSKAVVDKIHAVRGEPQTMTPKGVKQAKAPRFETVLVRLPDADSEVDPAKKFRVARIRVICRMPDVHATVPETLAYVDWYKPLSRFNDDLGMYEISPSTRMNQPHSEVIPISGIARSCHLIPVFGRRAIDPTWVSEYVLDQCKSFYLNPYLRHHDFYLLRYLPDLHAKWKAAEERRVRMRQFGRAAR
ncbi:hypothetical protein C8F01DRAFT_999273 [Mycena amicta]|nr:hypothetical protein C8F01DRAFT_999273 [Mycena amicta]